MLRYQRLSTANSSDSVRLGENSSSTAGCITEVSFFSLNCALWPWGGEADIGRARKIAQRVKEYDVVVLQEVFRTGWFCCRDRRWIELLRDELPGWSIADMDYGRTCRAVDSGLVVATKHSIGRTQAVPMATTGGAWWLCPCVRKFAAQAVEVKLYGRSLWVYNNHLIPDEGTSAPFKMSCKDPDELRRAQLVELADVVALEPDPWIACGDFNFDATRLGEESRAILGATGVSFPNDCMFNVTLPWSKHPRHTMNWVSDHFYWGGGVQLAQEARKTSEEGDNKFSDHYAFDATILLP